MQVARLELLLCAGQGQAGVALGLLCPLLTAWHSCRHKGRCVGGCPNVHVGLRDSLRAPTLPWGSWE